MALPAARRKITGSAKALPNQFIVRTSYSRRNYIHFRSGPFMNSRESISSPYCAGTYPMTHENHICCAQRLEVRRHDAALKHNKAVSCRLQRLRPFSGQIFWCLTLHGKCYFACMNVTHRRSVPDCTQEDLAKNRGGPHLLHRVLSWWAVRKQKDDGFLFFSWRSW